MAAHILSFYSEAYKEAISTIGFSGGAISSSSWKGIARGHDERVAVKLL